MIERLRRSLTRAGVGTSHPAAFAVVLIYTAAWIHFDRATLDWQGVATLATWTMTLLIQRVGHRDTQAIQAKLDELLRAERNASNDIIKLDHAEPEEIQRHRERAHSESPTAATK